ncbi:21 kDa protein [Morella rubra]|uniref:21 kDa protein n=1 Tax=Morella rubra TaxID=262757 RepID=A0A6A1VGA5_9ROSI|nr:21 kDa protein [Morella rubra]
MEAAYALTIVLNLLFLSYIHTTLAATATSTVSTKNYDKYIKTACRRTTYSQVCYSSLSPYASKIKENPLKLCTAALSVSIKAAKNASSTIAKLSKQKGLTRREAAVIKDCIENTKDAIYELKESLDAMGHLRGSDLKFQIADIKTWVSAALTDENTCTDGFDGQRLSAAVKNKVRNAILNVARTTSNALSLINSIYS